METIETTAKGTFLKLDGNWCSTPESLRINAKKLQKLREQYCTFVDATIKRLSYLHGVPFKYSILDVSSIINNDYTRSYSGIYNPLIQVELFFRLPYDHRSNWITSSFVVDVFASKAVTLKKIKLYIKGFQERINTRLSQLLI